MWHNIKDHAQHVLDMERLFPGTIAAADSRVEFIRTWSPEWVLQLKAEQHPRPRWWKRPFCRHGTNLWFKEWAAPGGLVGPGNARSYREGQKCLRCGSEHNVTRGICR